MRPAIAIQRVAAQRASKRMAAADEFRHYMRGPMPGFPRGAATDIDWDMPRLVAEIGGFAPPLK
jgi:hypothetical protein